MENQTHKYNNFEERYKFQPNYNGMDEEVDEGKELRILNDQFSAFGKALKKTLRTK